MSTLPECRHCRSAAVCLPCLLSTHSPGNVNCLLLQPRFLSVTSHFAGESGVMKGWPALQERISAASGVRLHRYNSSTPDSYVLCTLCDACRWKQYREIRQRFRRSICKSTQISWLQIHRSEFNSRRYQISWVVMDLERGPLKLVSTIEELLQRKSSGSGLETREYGFRESAALTKRHPSIRKSWR
jgi:hypothetical protein